ncbi:YCF48-related protein [Pseudomonas sp. LS44]|uniref:WD40/YVTN/BNR-like repeat-containing protein n=1 Tax=Pseudomonas sp. LS44 TaxID=1357074 RepID=UPI00215A9D05|nr:YCF48-related protein [Pseudomonas sp. LS44]UVE19174.1 YCF48-related protein [Pseudomonas sp. LS44]
MSCKFDKARRGVLGAVLCGLSACAVASVPAAEVGEPASRAALASSQAEKSVLLGAARTGSDRLVSVGERGLVLLSDDSGAHWRQAVVPVSVTLTAVRFAGQQGVAVGHAGVVLTSGDGGETWVQRLDGRRAAEVAMRDAQASKDEQLIYSAQLLVDEGPDKPFLDATIGADGQLLVVGAYGMVFASPDMGQSWNSWSGRLDNPTGLHLYAVRQRGQALLVAGERGLVLSSVDGGASFKRLEVPYQGSLFTAELPGDGDMVVAGLKGSLLRSRDGGASWQRLDAADASSFTASTLGRDGSLYLVTQAGHVLGLQRDGLVQLSSQAMPSLNGILPVNPQSVVLLSNLGLTTLQLNAGTEAQP